MRLWDLRVGFHGDETRVCWRRVKTPPKNPGRCGWKCQGGGGGAGGEVCHQDDEGSQHRAGMPWDPLGWLARVSSVLGR